MLEFVAVSFVVAAALSYWARWLRRQPRSPRWVGWLPVAFVACWAAGSALALRGLLHAFAAVERASPALKAQQLAEGIAAAMNIVAATIGTQLLGIGVLLGATWRYHWSARDAASASRVPYR